MQDTLPFSQFMIRYADDTQCLEEIVRIKYPNGIYCRSCKKTTRHYKITGRTAYACTFCRKHTYPLTGTIFEKSSTPLHTWFFALFLMTQTRGNFSAKRLQRELNVTYKTAWRIHKLIHELMGRNGGNLLKDNRNESSVKRWTFFNTFEFTVSQKIEK